MSRGETHQGWPRLEPTKMQVIVPHESRRKRFESAPQAQRRLGVESLRRRFKKPGVVAMFKDGPSSFPLRAGSDPGLYGVVRPFGFAGLAGFA